MSGEGKDFRRQGEKGQDDDSGAEGEVESLPDGGSDPCVLTSAGILGHECVHVCRRTDEGGHERDADQTGGSCGCDGLRRVPGEEHPVDEMLNDDGSRTQNERDGELEDFPVASFIAPASFYLSKHLADNIRILWADAKGNFVRLRIRFGNVKGVQERLNDYENENGTTSLFLDSPFPNFSPAFTYFNTRLWIERFIKCFRYRGFAQIIFQSLSLPRGRDNERVFFTHPT